MKFAIITNDSIDLEKEKQTLKNLEILQLVNDEEIKVQDSVKKVLIDKNYNSEEFNIFKSFSEKPEYIIFAFTPKNSVLDNVLFDIVDFIRKTDIHFEIIQTKPFTIEGTKKNNIFKDFLEKFKDINAKTKIIDAQSDIIGCNELNKIFKIRENLIRAEIDMIIFK